MRKAAVCIVITLFLPAVASSFPRGGNQTSKAIELVRESNLPRAGKRGRKPDWSNREKLETAALFTAMERGNIELIQGYIDEGLEIDKCYEWYSRCIPVLSWAMVAKHAEVAKYLLAEGTDVNQMSTREIVNWEGQKPDNYDLLEREKKMALREQYIQEYDLYSPLMYAVSSGFLEGAELLIAQGADVNAIGFGGFTALMIAAANGNAEMVKILLAAEASVNDQLNEDITLRRPGQIGSTGASALWMAAHEGQLEVVELLMKSGAEIELEASCEAVQEALSDEVPCAAADIARLRGHAKLAGLIGGKSTVESDGGVTIEVTLPEDPKALFRQLMTVFQEDDVETFRAYLDAGLDVDSMSKVEGYGSSETLLTEAASRKAAGIVGLLIEEGADVDLMAMTAPQKKKRTIGKWIVTTPSSEEEEIELVPQRSALMAAVASDCDECFTLLLEAEADVNAASALGETALMWTALKYGDREKSVAFARELVEAGADIEASITYEEGKSVPWVDGATTLWIAASKGLYKLVELLHGMGADLEAEAFCGKERHALKDERLCSARRIAELKKSGKTVALIDRLQGLPKEGSVVEDPKLTEIVDVEDQDKDFHQKLRTRMKDERLEEWRSLIDEGLDVDTMLDTGGLCPLVSMAALKGATGIVGLLLERGADPGKMSLGREGDQTLFMTGRVIVSHLKERVRESSPKSMPVYSPLMYASFGGNTKAVELLLKSGVDENAKGAAGYTALMAASVTNRPLVLKKLIDAGARVDERLTKEGFEKYTLSDGATALWLAASEGALPAVALLLRAGADPTLEAECRAQRAEPTEERCDSRRIAELMGHSTVATLIDNHQRK